MNDGKTTSGLSGIDHNICMVLYNTKNIFFWYITLFYPHNNSVKKVYATILKKISLFA